MSTKISNLPELGVNASGGIDRGIIDGNEFFPIIDFDANSNLQTFKIKLDTLFLSGQGYEKLTDLAITEDSNTQFKLTYTKEDNSTDVITIDKYVIQNGDVFFQHIRTADYFTSDVGNLIESDSSSNLKLATAGAIDTHITHRLYGTSEYDDTIKGYFGDSTTSRTTGTHILKDFRLNSEVAQDFLDLLDDVKPSLNTFKKIEEQFDTIDYSDKIGTGQVNINQFVINDQGDLSSRLNIKPLSIGTALLTNKGIVTSKIKDSAITTLLIDDGAVTTSKINVDAVVTDKIKDENVTPAKLSVGAPQWNAPLQRVDIPHDLFVDRDITANRNIKSLGTDISLFNSAATNRTISNGRAISHDIGDTLIVNKYNDYIGGVHIKGLVMAPDQHVSRIIASTDNTLVTKAYVDRADILLNPIAEDKIQDDAVIHRHMTPDSVDTEELFDFCVTSPKVEAIGPHWDDTGTVKISNHLDIDGHDLTIGDIGGTSVTNQTRLILRGPETTDEDYRLRRGLATLTRGKGINGALILNNTGGGDITLTRSGTDSLRLTNAGATLPKVLQIQGFGSASVNGTNLSNVPLLIGKEINGIGIDNNEIVQKGHHLHLGVAASNQNIFLRAGASTLATLYGNSGNLSVQGDIISETGVIRRNADTADLTIRGGTTNANGANIKLYGVNNAANSNQAVYNADQHTFSNQSGTITALHIDAKTRRIKLFAEGTLPNHLVTKRYVDDEVFKPIQNADIITARRESGFYETSNAILGNGWPESNNGSYHLLTNTSSNTSNYDALQFAAPYNNQEVYFRSTNNNGSQSWSKLWHTNNQGAGSGLDADKLDGREAAAFSLTSHLHDNRYRKLTTLIGYNDLTADAPSWNSANVYIHNNLDVSVNANVDGSLRVGGQIRSVGPDFYLFNQTRAGAGNLHSGRALVHGVNDTLNINYAKDYTGGVLIHGNVVARDQSIGFIASNRRALATQEYVLSKQAETFPDLNYIRKQGDVVYGTLSWTDVSGEGLEWSKYTDKASIKFYNESDADPDCRLQFEIGDNNTEYFTFVLNPSGARPNITLLKIGHNELSYKGYDVWHDGNTTRKVDSTHLDTNSVTNIKIVDNAINERKIASNAVTGSKIPSNTITSSHIQDLSITTSKIPDNAITTAKIPNNAIVASKIPDSSIVTSKILDKAITGIKIDNGAITSNKIGDLQVTRNKIGASQVSTDKLQALSVTSDKIADNSIISSKLPSKIITTDKIANLTITSEKLLNLTITSEKLVNSSVTGEKILNGAITPTKLSSGGPSWNANNDLYVKGTLILGQPVGGDGPYTGITAVRESTVDTLCLYSNDKIKFGHQYSGLQTMVIHSSGAVDGGRVSIGSNNFGNGKLHIEDANVPLSFKETDESGAGSMWRMPLDAKVLRFDSSDDGITFTDYTSVLALYPDGKIVGRSLTKPLINQHSRSLITKEYLDDKFAENTVTAQYVQTSITNALTFKSMLHYIDLYGQGRTKGNPSGAQITWAKGQLGTTVKSGHRVMVRSRYYEHYGWGNGSGYRDKTRIYIYKVSGTYPNSSWTISHSL